MLQGYDHFPLEKKDFIKKLYLSLTLFYILKNMLGSLKASDLYIFK